jgi:serine/threonine protein kinase
LVSFIEDPLENSNYLFIIMPLYNNDLFQMLPHCGFSDEITKLILLQVIRGLRFMHRCGVVNLDLSLENILCLGTPDSADFRVVLADFGNAERLPFASSQYPFGVVSSFAGRGKNYYFAPEYLEANVILDTLKIDIWQLVITSSTHIFFA